LNFPKLFECGGHDLPTYDPDGEDGQFSFLCLENGIKVPTREYELVKRVLEGKMSVNLQIKLWAEDLGNNLILMPDELKTYCVGYPEWVFKATMEQARSRIMKEVGFIPTFMRFEDVS